MPRKMTNAKPTKFDVETEEIIEQIKKRTKPQLSLSEIVRRSVRFAGPKMLSGELPVSDGVVLLATPTRKPKKLFRARVTQGIPA